MAAQTLMKSLPAEIPPPTVTDFLMGDHVDTVVLLKHFEKASIYLRGTTQCTLSSSAHLIFDLFYFYFYFGLQAASSGDKQLQETLADAISVVVRLHSQAEMDVLCK